jgi:hypothetical protein
VLLCVLIALMGLGQADAASRLVRVEGLSRPGVAVDAPTFAKRADGVPVAAVWAERTRRGSSIRWARLDVAGAFGPPRTAVRIDGRVADVVAGADVQDVVTVAWIAGGRVRALTLERPGTVRVLARRGTRPFLAHAGRGGKWRRGRGLGAGGRAAAHGRVAGSRGRCRAARRLVDGD